MRSMTLLLALAVRWGKELQQPPLGWPVQGDAALGLPGQSGDYEGNFWECKGGAAGAHPACAP